MKAKIKNIIFLSVVNIALIVAIFWGVYNYLPLNLLDKFSTAPKKMTLGSTITTILGTDKLKDSRAVINTNFSNLNTDKLEISDYAATTTSSLTQVGALSSGSLASGFTPVTVPLGGTASTTLSSNQVLLGNGASPIKVVNSLGTSGFFLQSQGAGSPPIWASSSVDTSVNFDWTGLHTFALLSTFQQATSTLLTAIDEFKVGATATTTIDSAGNLDVAGTITGDGSGITNIPSKIGVMVTPATVENSTSEGNLVSIAIPANTLGTANVLNFRFHISNITFTTSNTLTMRLKYGATTIATAVVTDGSSGGADGFIEGTIVANAATNAQKGMINWQITQGAANAWLGDVDGGTAAEDSTGALNLVISAQWTTANAGSVITVDHGYVESIQ